MHPLHKSRKLTPQDQRTLLSQEVDETPFIQASKIPKGSNDGKGRCLSNQEIEFLINSKAPPSYQGRSPSFLRAHRAICQRCDEKADPHHQNTLLDNFIAECDAEDLDLERRFLGGFAA
jgi:hypothetical protein